MEASWSSGESTSLAVEILRKIARLEGDDVADLPPLGRTIGRASRADGRHAYLVSVLGLRGSGGGRSGGDQRQVSREALY